MKRKQPLVAPLSLPDDELVGTWIAGKPERQAVFHDYKTARILQQKDPGVQVLIPPPIVWSRYTYREHEPYAYGEQTHAVSPTTLGERIQRSHELLIKVAANKQTHVAISGEQSLELHTHVAKNDIVLEEVTIVVHAHAQVTLHDYLSSDSNDNLCGRSINIILLAGAQMTYVFDQRTREATKLLYFLSVHIHEHARFEGYFIDVGGTYRHYGLDVYHQAPHAESYVRGLTYLKNNEQAAIFSRQEHRANATTSDVTLRGLVSGTAALHAQSLIKIHEHAHNSNAAQESAAFLVSPQARASALPSLEVATSQVQCRHGSAVGTLQPDELFYLQARGIDYQQARGILVDTFMSADIPAYLKQQLRSLAHECINE